MPRQIFSFARRGFMVVLALLLATSAAANHWRSLRPGLDYRDFGSSVLSPWSHIHVFRVDLSQYQLDLVTARALSKPLASADEFAHKSNALLAINGGFFDQKSQPLGLRIGQNTQHNPLKPISWWGIFYIKHQHAYMSNYKRFPASSSVDFAVQSGPRLLVNGKTLALKEGFAERSALGITEDGHVIILVTQNSPMTTRSIARLMRSTLNCKDALNLDGGSSSQLYANIDSFKINARGFSDVSDAIIVKPRR